MNHKYLLDTNILLRTVDTSSPQYNLVATAITTIFQANHECFITPQNIIEFWVVATRPVEVNGLGWNCQETSKKIDQLISQFTLLQETPEIFSKWLKLVTEYSIKGKRTHDIRLLAVMQFYQISHLLTFNPSDFIALPEILIIHPQSIKNIY